MRDYKPQSEKTGLEKALQSFAQTRFGGFLFITVFPAIDKRLIPWTNGRLSTGGSQPIVLLHVKGAKSGVERSTPLLATKSEGRLILVASKAGATSHPAWFHNVKANPDVEVTVEGKRRPMRARIAEESERDQLWRTVVDHYTGFATYQGRAGGRQIPLIVLTER